MRIGSCGETRERTAARAHLILTIFTRMEFVGALGIVMTTTVTGLWHWRSVGVHERRAIEKGEA